MDCKLASVPVFQLTRPRGTRHVVELVEELEAQFQLTRPRGTRPDGREFRRAYYSFNSRVRGGRDYVSFIQFNIWRCFNSRVRGGRDVLVSLCLVIFRVSTHASAGDATQQQVLFLQENMFQLTRPRGTRRILNGAFSRDKMFQLTRPRGTRRSYLFKNIWISCFNSRVRGGRDAALSKETAPIVVSTHASAGDATSRLRLRVPAGGGFNSRVRGGRDLRV